MKTLCYRCWLVASNTYRFPGWCCLPAVVSDAVGRSRLDIYVYAIYGWTSCNTRLPDAFTTTPVTTWITPTTWPWTPPPVARFPTRPTTSYSYSPVGPHNRLTPCRWIRFSYPVGCSRHYYVPLQPLRIAYPVNARRLMRGLRRLPLVPSTCRLTPPCPLPG